MPTTESLSERDAALLAGLRAGERRSLAQAITLAESTRKDHQARAQRLLQAALPATGAAVRIGLSGVPGAGKSSLIEALGLHLVSRGHRLAVLAIDPSSAAGRGSILGDKTRMERLAREPNVYIRPSPSGGALGGVAPRTREAMLMCEAAGFDVVIVETVGVGQSEIAVAGMTDCFVLMQLPNAGDDLQAIKRGVAELADLIVYNKADIDPTATQVAMSQMANALPLLRGAFGHWRPRVLQVSALRSQGVEELWQAILEHRACLERHGELQRRRARQALDWMWMLVEGGLRARFTTCGNVRAALIAQESAVVAGAVDPGAAAAALLNIFLESNHLMKAT